MRCFFYSGDLFIQIFFIYILQHHCTNFQRKSEQCDESVCIVMIVLITGCETCQRLTVERVWRSCAGFDDVSFVELEFYFTGDILLGRSNKCLDCFAKRSEPFSFVSTLASGCPSLSLQIRYRGREPVLPAGHVLP